MGFYLNGDRIPDAATLHQICTACDISADWLLGLPGGIKSTIPSIKAVVQYTGLTEENASFLHDPSKAVGDDGQLNLYRKSLFMLINDLIGLCQSTDVNTSFFQIQHILSLLEDQEIPHTGDGFNQQIAEGIAKKRGYAVLPINDSIAFYASQLAKSMADAIECKYRVFEKTEPTGTPETKYINGREITIFKE